MNRQPDTDPSPHRLDVYVIALDFNRAIAMLARDRGNGYLRDQLRRASLSIVLNIAEGAGRFSPRDKARFYAMARGSACECAAVLDVLERDPHAPMDCRNPRAMLVRIVQMLTRLGAAMRRR
jgi:four helix bundle protein